MISGPGKLQVTINQNALLALQEEAKEFIKCFPKDPKVPEIQEALSEGRFGLFADMQKMMIDGIRLGSLLLNPIKVEAVRITEFESQQLDVLDLACPHVKSLFLDFDPSFLSEPYKERLFNCLRRFRCIESFTLTALNTTEELLDVLASISIKKLDITAKLEISQKEIISAFLSKDPSVEHVIILDCSEVAAALIENKSIKVNLNRV